MFYDYTRIFLIMYMLCILLTHKQTVLVNSCLPKSAGPLCASTARTRKTREKRAWHECVTKLDYLSY